MSDAFIKVRLTKKLGAVGEVEVELGGNVLIKDGTGGLLEFEYLVNMGEGMIKHYMEHHTTNSRILGGEDVITREFDAIEIRVTMDKGKRYWKVATPEYSEFGIPFWPEHMKACGIDPKNIPDEGHKCKEGTKAIVEMVDGKPKRVLKLVKV